jgi:hypothetical protein
MANVVLVSGRLAAIALQQPAEALVQEQLGWLGVSVHLVYHHLAGAFVVDGEGVTRSKQAAALSSRR